MGADEAYRQTGVSRPLHIYWVQTSVVFLGLDVAAADGEIHP